MRDSSCVSRSSLFNIVSISLSPNSFFANCSTTSSEVIADYTIIEGPLTDSSSADLFLRYGKYRNQLDHDLRHNIRHKRVQGDLGINMETIEEVSEAFKEFEEGVITCAYTINGLMSSEYQMDSAREGGCARRREHRCRRR